MSSRAISNYLKTEHGVKISAASIARALREPEKHLAAMLGEVQEASQIFAAAHNASGPAMVTSKIAFEGFSERDPDFKIKDEKALLDAKFEYGEAVDALKNWFALDERFREFAQAFIVKFEKFEDGAPPRSTKARTPKTSRKNPK